ncbi:hypothetical protein BKA80DRAFT_261758 [Phyllosticta citrichinensis]
MVGEGFAETSRSLQSRLRTDICISELLIENGADVDAQGGFYGSAVQAAASVANEQGVRLLLEKGADPSLRGGKYGSELKASRHRCIKDCHHAAFEGMWNRVHYDIRAQEKDKITELLIDACASDSE